MREIEPDNKKAFKLCSLSFVLASFFSWRPCGRPLPIPRPVEFFLSVIKKRLIKKEGLSFHQGTFDVQPFTKARLSSKFWLGSGRMVRFQNKISICVVCILFRFTLFVWRIKTRNFIFIKMFYVHFKALDTCRTGVVADFRCNTWGACQQNS